VVSQAHLLEVVASAHHVPALWLCCPWTQCLEELRHEVDDEEDMYGMLRFA